MKGKSYNGIIDYTVAPHLHLIGSSQCVVDGLKGILEYSREKVFLNLGSYSAVILGSNLIIDEFSPDGAIIEGNIMAVEFSSND